MSRIPGFYKLDRAARRAALERVTDAPLSEGELEALVDGIDHDLLDGFVENVIGGFSLPLGVAVNFSIDGRDVLVPMVVE